MVIHSQTPGQTRSPGPWKIEVKVEVNFVMRGTVEPVRTAALTPAARDTLLAELEIPVVSLEDV